MQIQEIKFRVWDKFNGVYYWSDAYTRLSSFFASMQALIDGENELIFERLTGVFDKAGLFDKDGRERWESDLYELRVNGIDSHVEIVTCEVKWSDLVGGFGFHRISEDSEQPDWIGMTDKNIIGIKYLGNIHENPELLTKPQQS